MNVQLKIWDKEQERFLDIGDKEGNASPRYYKHLYFILVGKLDEDGYDYEIDAEIYLYSGMKDRNGINICEGDIVKVYHSQGKEKSTFHSVVEYKQEWCGFYIGDDLCLSHSMNIEIVGNIKETPELLMSF